VQERIVSRLGKLAQAVRFVCPTSHQEALAAVNEHCVMLDTFPYSSGLTAYEAASMGTEVQVIKTGELFCERHTVGSRG
jgi:predicted O-linked N-acetylglucosamine transferase (SPINDLY family)